MAIRLSEYSLIPHQVDTGNIVSLGRAELWAAGDKERASYVQSAAQLGDAWVSRWDRVQQTGQLSQASVDLKKLEKDLTQVLSERSDLSPQQWDQVVQDKASSYFQGQYREDVQNHVNRLINDYRERGYTLIESQQKLTGLDESKMAWEKSLEDSIQLRDPELFNEQVSRGSEIFITEEDRQSVLNEGLQMIAGLDLQDVIYENPFSYLNKASDELKDAPLYTQAQQWANKLKHQYANHLVELHQGGKKLSASALDTAVECGLISDESKQYYQTHSAPTEEMSFQTLASIYRELDQADVSAYDDLAIRWCIDQIPPKELQQLQERKDVLSQLPSEVRNQFNNQIGVMQRYGVWGDQKSENAASQFCQDMDELIHIAQNYPDEITTRWDQFLTAKKERFDQSWIRFEATSKKGDRLV